MGWTQYLLPIFFLGLIIWTHYILFVGDEREMVDCSKTEVFLKEWNRMCDFSQDTCQQCYLYEMVNIGSSCHAAMRANPKQVIDVVQKWSDEHPRKTRQSEFLKMYPNAMLCEGEYLNIAPCHLDRNIRKGCSEGCINCHREYWLAAVE